ncbi:Inner membrane protein YebS [Zhongshania aliphaticivorans]|uniref:Inner membrane protein YebS n=1 Tax=Zhongshania aliphaticivorans TaxID=1470434 RepID=A0A5S9Q046_9GAMM|nr:paraquat-inducible protein A [Zhongshania aliphaticivorans]CAA0092716.1 Inner membrane protein YebS [Zhongshania aliphaticivorans]CAA0110151.1 Inner membrane protein YebS [Zhongshania aliphaticivorans]
MTISAKQQGIARCTECGKLSHLPKLKPNDKATCPRCNTALSFRKPHSLQRSWAFTIAAIALLVPANILPILTIISFGQGDPDTIMSGVVTLWEAELQAIAIVVFIASIAVPVLKLIILIILMLVVQLHLPLSRQQCTVLYRFIHFIGRWSMLDLFMISILVTLVHLGNIATVESGPAATAFAAVVVLTLLAANNFDPRLLWDLDND